MSDKLYEISNKITSYKVKINPHAKRIFKEMYEGKVMTEYKMNMLVRELSNDFKVNSPCVDYSGVEPSRSKNGRMVSKIHGQYRTGGAIRIYMYTAKRKKLKANKTTLDTLIHEFVHHLDFEYHKWYNSLHTKGFYHRITFLKTALLA